LEGNERAIIASGALDRYVRPEVSSQRSALVFDPAEDSHWSGAADYAGVRIGPLRLDRESLPVFVRL